MLVFCPYLKEIVDNTRCFNCKNRIDDTNNKQLIYRTICLVCDAEFDGRIYSNCQDIKEGVIFELPDYNVFDEYSIRDSQYLVTPTNNMLRTEPRIMYAGDKLLVDNDYFILSIYNVVGPKFNIFQNQTKGKPDYKRNEELSKRMIVVPGTLTKDFGEQLVIDGYAVSTSSPPVPSVITDNYNRTYTIYYQLI